MKKPSRNSVFLAVDGHWIQLSATDPACKPEDLKCLLTEFLSSCLANYNLYDIPLEEVVYKIVRVGLMESTRTFFAEANNQIVYFGENDPEGTKRKISNLLRSVA